MPLKFVDIKSKNKPVITRLSSRKPGQHIISINQSIMGQGYNLTSYIESNQSKIDEVNADATSYGDDKTTNRKAPKSELRDSDNFSKIK